MVAEKVAQSVQATINYAKPHTDGTELFRHVHCLPDGSMPTNMAYDTRTVQVTDIESSGINLSLHQNGFQLDDFPLSSLDPAIDWQDSEQVKRLYYPVVEQVIKRVSGGTKVHIYEHTLRAGTVRSKGQGDSSKQRSPIPHIHVDYTTRSGEDRLHLELPDEADCLSRTPFAIVQLWRPLRGPVQESPLTLMDAATARKEDYMSLRAIFETRFAFDYILKFSPAHRWYYAQAMRADQAYVFKCYDSRPHLARFTPHTSFSDPSVGSDVPKRESIEVRSYVFWENDPPQDIAREFEPPL